VGPQTHAHTHTHTHTLSQNKWHGGINMSVMSLDTLSFPQITRTHAHKMNVC